MTKQLLTGKQRTLLDFIQRYFDEHRQSPFIREIQAGCQIASYKSALDRLNALERKGFIKRAANKHRGIKVLRRAPEMASAAQAILEEPSVEAAV